MLEAKSITYSIRNRELISDVNLTFLSGILYAILGPNGSGKSTLLKALTGIWKPTSGQVYWQGKDLLRESRRTISKTISLVPQHALLPFDFTVIDMAAMGLYPHGMGMQGDASERIRQALEMVDAWHLRHRSISQLSHGERQRIYIARALLTESPVLMLDEPTANLDICHQLAIWQLLKQLIKQGKVVIVTSHDLHATERYCDQIAIMNQGRCVANGPFAEVMMPEIVHSVFGVVESSAVLTKQFALKHERTS